MLKKGWLGVLCSFVLVLTLFLFFVPISGFADFEFSDIDLIAREKVVSGEDVIFIDTEPELLGDDFDYLSLSVETSSQVYNYIGVPEFPVKFNLIEPDRYVIKLFDKTADIVISEVVVDTREFDDEFVEGEDVDDFLSELKVDGSKDSFINNPGGLIVENHANVKRPVRFEEVGTFRGRGLSLDRPINAVENILFRGLRDTAPPRLGIEDITHPISIRGRDSVKSYAIDPTTVDFDEATVSVVAEGTTLYICKEYNFSTQECFGDLQKKRDITPGEVYTFTLTPEDPLFVEVDDDLDCGFVIDTTGSGGTLSDSVVCEHTIQVPQNAVSFFLEEITYVVDADFDSAGPVSITSSSQSGYFDNDDVLGNGNEILVGSSSVTTPSTLTWTNSDIDETGSQSFNEDNCDNWPDYCTYYIHLEGDVTYNAPGNQNRFIYFSLILNEVETTINYTEPGDFAVVLESPNNNFITRADPDQLFEFVPNSESTLIESCSLYTSEGGWSSKNSTSNVVEGSVNSLSASFSDEGSYSWNVLCEDENSDVAWGINNRTIHIDRTPPSISLVSPIDNFVETDSSVVSFAFEVSDDSPISNCSLLVNDSVVNTLYDVPRDEEVIISSVFSNNVFNWNIMCYDVAGNDAVSDTRSLTVDVPPVIYEGLWFETATGDCSTFPCEIGLAQETDGDEDSISGSVSSGQTVTIVEAASPFMSSNGAEISVGSIVDFSTYFSEGDNRLTPSWQLYKRSDSGDNTLICSEESTSASSDNSANIGSCSIPSDIRLESTDSLFYVIRIENDHPNQARSFNHLVDHPESFVDVLGFTQIGSLSAFLNQPNESLSVGQGGSFDLVCDVACEQGSCLDVDVYAQVRSGGSWSDVGTSGVVVLGSEQSNPEFAGDVFNSTVPVTISLEGGTPGVVDVRCLVESKYSSAVSDFEEVIVATTEPPVISLDFPENNSWVNDEPIDFLYTPQTFSTLDYCELYVDGSLEDTDTSPSANSQNSFSVSGLSENSYNWSVTCVDIGGLVGESNVSFFDVDRTPPYELNIFSPQIPEDTLTQSWVNFEWIVRDARSSEMTCNIFVDDVLTESVTSFNDTVSNVTVEGFDIGNYTWRIECEDLAGNVNVSDTFNLSIVDVPPVVELVSPENFTGVNTSPVALEYVPFDGFGLQQCSLFINDTLEETDTGVVPNEVNSFSFNALEEAYSWRVECLDSNDNTGISDTWVFFGDFTPPTIELHSPVNDAYFPDSSVLFSYTGFDNWDPLTCTVNFNDEPLFSSNTTSGVTVSETVSGLPDGFHDWNVMCVDIGGNVNVSETRDFTINESPTINLDSPLIGSHLNDLVINLSYFAFDNDGFDFCELYLNDEFEMSNSSNVSSGELSSFLVPDLDEGLYDWSVLCQDSGMFSNVNVSDTWSFVVDRTPPSLSLLDPLDAQVVETSSYDFRFNVIDEFSSNMSCDVFLDDELVESLIVENNSEVAVEIGGFFTGSYNWSVACSDEAGNINVSDTINFEVLLPPKVTLVSPANNTGSDSQDTEFSFIPSEGSGEFPVCSLILNNDVVDTISDAPLGEVSTFLVENMDDGAYGWNVQCTDTNDMTGSADDSWIYYVDTEPPYEILMFNPLNETVEIFNNVTFSFLARDEVSPEMYCDVILTEYEPVVDTYSLTPDSLLVENNTVHNFSYLLPDGNYSWSVFCSDIAGLYNQSEEFFFEVDAPPNVTLVSPENYSWFNTDSVTLTYLPEDDFGISQCELIINDEVIESTSSVLNKNLNTFELDDLDEGEYNWTVACTDLDNNVFAPEPFSFYVDLLAPEVELHNPLQDELLDESPIVFNWTVTDLLSPVLYCDLNINGEVESENIQVLNGVPYQESVFGLSEDNHTWSVTCRDLAGNVDESETRDFSVFIPPEITLISPDDNLWTNVTNQEFVYRVFDDTGVEQCSLFINDELNQTDTSVLNDAQNSFFVNNMEGIYSWRVECIDTTVLNVLGVSNTRTLNVDLVPPSVSFVTENDTWFNDSPILEFILEDDLANVIDYEVYVNGSLEDSGSGNNGVVTSSELSGLTDGSYEVFVIAEDLAGNVNISETLIINIDTVPPVVNLNYPVNDSEVFSSDVNLSFTATDNIADPLVCDVTLNNDLVREDLSVSNGVEEIVELTGLIGGLYVWNVTCFDFAGNPGVSDTWEFFVPIPDLSVNNTEIYFNETNPREGELINVTATIRNIGEGLAEDFDVEFWANEVDVVGNQIGDTINVDSLGEGSAINVSTSFNVPIGSTEIFAVVNPDQRVVESDYDNNIASRNISVEFWHYALGTTDDSLRVTDASLGLLFDWNVDNSTGSNIYVTDFDSQISWTTLQALGKDVNDNVRMEDFVLLDNALGADEFGDSINNTYTRNGEILSGVTFEIFGQTIEDVPVVNSTTSDNFKTGILWDHSESSQYSGSENVVFITQVNKDQVGYQGGINDFEIRVPATLREYQGPDLERVIFYTEIK